MIDKILTEYEQVVEKSFLDDLTGLHNYGSFRHLIDIICTQSLRSSKRFTLALIDITNFSHYNSKYGTLQGDHLLKKTGDHIIESIRKSDIAARLWRDQFAIQLDGSIGDDAILVAERIKSHIEESLENEITISIGLASFPTKGTTFKDLYDSAKESLDLAKQDGRSRIISLDSPEAPKDPSQYSVLVVDDDKLNGKIIEFQLRNYGYHIYFASNGEEAIEFVKSHPIDLIISDIMMPKMNGFQLCRRIKKFSATRLIPVVLMTTLEAPEVKLTGIDAGADGFVTKPFQQAELLARTKSLLHMHELNKKLTDFENVLFSLTNIVEVKDSYTQGHSIRVSQLSRQIGFALGLDNDMLDKLVTAGQLHDIGKIGIHKSILNKPGALTDEEFLEIQKHPLLGYQICVPLKDNLGISLDAIRHHHEKLDGSGYPDGLKGDEILLGSRILAVADIYDALTTDRPYRLGFSIDKAFMILDDDAQRGKIDKQIVSILKDLILS